MYIFEYRRLRVVGRLARSGYGALASIFSILAGGVAFVLLTRAAVRHVQKTKPVREFLCVSVDA